MAEAMRCPLCEQPISSKRKYREVEQRLKSQVEDELAKERKKHKQDIARGKRAAEQEAARIRRKADEALKKAKDESEKLSADAKKLKQAQQALQGKERRLKAEKKKLRADVRKQVAASWRAKVEAARKKAQEEAKRESNNDLRKLTSERKQLKSKVDELTRKLERQTPDQRGSWQEEQLADDLGKAFPRDAVERIRKGRKGADVKQTVIEKGKALGTIIYESKNVGKWDPRFVDKAKSYRRQYDTPHVVIVSTAFPPNEREFCVLRSNIIVVSPSKAIHVAQVLRQAVVKIGKLELSCDMRPEMVDALYKYVRSQEFKQRLAGLAHASSKLRELQDKEKCTHEGHWKKQQRHFEAIEECRLKIDVGIADILEQEAERPKSKILRLASGK